jgi:hypothetical protein
MKKYKLSMMLLVLIVAVITCSFFVFAATDTESNTYTEGDYKYTVENGVARITGFVGAGGDITIPTELGGYPVHEVAYKAFARANINAAIVPDGVFLEHMAFINSGVTSVQLGKYYESAYSNTDSYAPTMAFGNCDNLETVVITEGAISVFASMFSDCEKLNTVFIPESMTLIDERAFHQSRNLKNVYYAGTQEQWEDIVIIFGNEYLESADIHFNATPTNGWYKKGGNWYYGRSYENVIGWLKENNSWYYMDNTGAMVTGWQKIGTTWYYFGDNGVMVTGWQQIGKYWYYFENSGAMVTDWLKLGNTWYYFKADGAMATGSLVIGNTTYKFASNGAWIS